jgi:uncharacterized protein YegL
MMCLVLGLTLTSLTPLTEAVHSMSMASMSMASRVSANFEQERLRMRRERKEFLANITGMTSIEAAYRILKEHSGAAAAIEDLLERGIPNHAGPLVAHKNLLRVHEIPSLIPATPAPVLKKKKLGSSNTEKARNMLNSMLSSVSAKYDQEEMECSVFFQTQCSLIETVREDVSSTNSEAAAWRGKVLSAQKEISSAEMMVPRLGEELDGSLASCNKRLEFLQRDLKVVLSDVSVMSDVLKLTECGANSFTQTNGLKLLKCNCSSAVTVAHPEVQAKLIELRSPQALRRIQESLAEMVEEAPEFPRDQQSTVPKLPMPLPVLPSDPCLDIDYNEGLDKGVCTLRTNPECRTLQNKFLAIQSETLDKREELLMEIQKLQEGCEKTKRIFHNEIQSYDFKLSRENAKLAEATAGENSAMEAGQMKSKEQEELRTSMHETRSSCSHKLRQTETEMCALKRIRGELLRMKGAAHPLVQDCELSDWRPRECSVSCGGGIQVLERSVLMPPSKDGVQCLPLIMKQQCNEQPCPVDCVMSEWSGFSSCSADCGGGVAERMRNVKVHPRYDGTPCGEQTETVACNMQACDSDCTLGEWSEWSHCSKQCNAGHRVQHRRVVEAAYGRGKCPAFNAADRMRRQPCNTEPCPVARDKPLFCRSKVDVVLVLDASDSTNAEGWKRVTSFAQRLTQAFEKAEKGSSDSQMSVIQFSGPNRAGTLKKCFGMKSDSLDVERDCLIKMVQHFSSDMDATRSKIAKLPWLKATTFTSGALGMASAELALARKDAKKVVLVVTDGRPLSRIRTAKVASLLRQHATLMFASVGLGRESLSDIREWASQPAEENVFNLRSYHALDTLSTIDALVSTMCEQVTPPVSAAPSGFLSAF